MSRICPSLGFGRPVQKTNSLSKLIQSLFNPSKDKTEQILAKIVAQESNGGPTLDLDRYINFIVQYRQTGPTQLSIFLTPPLPSPIYLTVQFVDQPDIVTEIKDGSMIVADNVPLYTDLQIQLKVHLYARSVTKMLETVRLVGFPKIESVQQISTTEVDVYVNEERFPDNREYIVIALPTDLEEVLEEDIIRNTNKPTTRNPIRVSDLIAGMSYNFYLQVVNVGIYIEPQSFGPVYLMPPVPPPNVIAASLLEYGAGFHLVFEDAPPTDYQYVVLKENEESIFNSRRFYTTTNEVDVELFSFDELYTIQLYSEKTNGSEQSEFLPLILDVNAFPSTPNINVYTAPGDPTGLLVMFDMNPPENGYYVVDIIPNEYTNMTKIDETHFVFSGLTSGVAYQFQAYTQVNQYRSIKTPLTDGIMVSPDSPDMMTIDDPSFNNRMQRPAYHHTVRVQFQSQPNTEVVLETSPTSHQVVSSRGKRDALFEIPLGSTVYRIRGIAKINHLQSEPSKYSGPILLLPPPPPVSSITPSKQFTNTIEIKIEDENVITPYGSIIATTQYGNRAILEPNSNTILMTGLSENTSYNIQVIQRTPFCDSEVVEETSSLLVKGSDFQTNMQISSVILSDATATVYWKDPIPDGTSLYVFSDPSTSYTKASAGSTSCQLSNLVPGESYRFFLQERRENEFTMSHPSEPSKESVIVDLPPPILLNAKWDEETESVIVMLSRAAPSRCAYVVYAVDRDKVQGVADGALVHFSGITPNDVFVFRGFAINEFGTRIESESTITLTTPPARPVIRSLTVSGVLFEPVRVELKDMVQKDEEVEIFSKQENETKLVGIIPSMQFVAYINGLIPGSTYTFYAKRKLLTTESNPSLCVGPVTLPVPEPEFQFVHASEGGRMNFMMTYGPPPGVEFRVSIEPSGNRSSLIVLTDGKRSGVFEGLSEGVKYRIRAIAVLQSDGRLLSQYTSYTKELIPPLETVSIESIETTTTSAIVRFTNPPPSSNLWYRIFLNDVHTFVDGTLSNKEVKIDGLVANTRYSFRAALANTENQGPLSNEIIQFTLPNTISIRRVGFNEQNKFEVQLSTPVPNGMIVQVETEPSMDPIEFTSGQMSAVVSGWNGNQTYTFKAKTVTEDKRTSSYTENLSYTILSTPSIQEVSRSLPLFQSIYVSLAEKPVEGVRYLVESNQNDRMYVDGSDSSVLFTQLKALTKYQFRVRAETDESQSAFSDYFPISILTEPLAPVVLSAVEDENNQLYVTFDKVPDPGCVYVISSVSSEQTTTESQITVESGYAYSIKQRYIEQTIDSMTIEI